jgi:DNA-binding Xre family transcriptional regulator
LKGSKDEILKVSEREIIDMIRHDTLLTDQILHNKNVLSTKSPVDDGSTWENGVCNSISLDYNVENSKIMVMNTKFAIAMKAANLSPRKLAYITGVPQKTIEAFAYGARDFNRCRVSMALQLARALNCDITDLLDKEGE